MKLALVQQLHQERNRAAYLALAKLPFADDPGAGDTKQPRELSLRQSRAVAYGFELGGGHYLRFRPRPVLTGRASGAILDRSTKRILGPVREMEDGALHAAGCIAAHDAEASLQSRIAQHPKAAVFVDDVAELIRHGSALPEVEAARIGRHGLSLIGAERIVGPRNAPILPLQARIIVGLMVLGQLAINAKSWTTSGQKNFIFHRIADSFMGLSRRMPRVADQHRQRPLLYLFSRLIALFVGQPIIVELEDQRSDFLKPSASVADCVVFFGHLTFSLVRWSTGPFSALSRLGGSIAPSRQSGTGLVCWDDGQSAVADAELFLGALHRFDPGRCAQCAELASVKAADIAAENTNDVPVIFHQFRHPSSPSSGGPRGPLRTPYIMRPIGPVNTHSVTAARLPQNCRSGDALRQSPLKGYYCRTAFPASELTAAPPQQETNDHERNHSS